MSHIHSFYRKKEVKNPTKGVDSAKKLSVASEDRRFLERSKKVHAKKLPGPYDRSWELKF